MSRQSQYKYFLQWHTHNTSKDEGRRKPWPPPTLQKIVKYPHGLFMSDAEWPLLGILNILILLQFCLGIIGGRNF